MPKGKTDKANIYEDSYKTAMQERHKVLLNRLVQAISRNGLA